MGYLCDEEYVLNLIMKSDDSQTSQDQKIFDPIVASKKTANQTDPLVNFQINNPIPPIKRLLKRLFSNEEITIKIPILTAIALVAFGLGGASGFLTALKIKLAEQIPVVATIFPTPTPVATPNPWINTTLFGTLTTQTSGTFYLVLDGGDVVQLLAPENVNLKLLSGRKILATGEYSAESKTMKVLEASGLRTFVSAAPVPTTKPEPEVSATPEPTSTPIFDY